MMDENKVNDVSEEEEDNPWDNYDWCYECGAYGDDWFINDEGELESSCEYCHIYRERMGIDD